MKALQTLQAGLLLLHNYQWLDGAGSVDYLNLHSKQFLNDSGQDAALIAKAPDITWHYVSKDLTPVPASSGPDGIPTCTFDTCPQLDILIVPGDDRFQLLPDEYNTYLSNFLHNENITALLTICTGSITVARSGLFDGLSVCSNKLALKELAAENNLPPNVTWIGDRRWHVDGKVWSSAGITAGIDLVAEFARVHFDPEVVEFGKVASEYVPRPDQPDPYAWVLRNVTL